MDSSGRLASTRGLVETCDPDIDVETEWVRIFEKGM